MQEEAEPFPPGERFEAGVFVFSNSVTRVEEPLGGAVLFPDVCRGQEAEMADADEVFRKHMKEETADEFDGIEGHGFLAAGFGVIADHERDSTVMKGTEPCVGDSDSVGVSTEIAKHGFGSAEWGLCVGDPIFVVERVQKLLPRTRLG